MRKLSTLTGITGSMISQIERNQVNPSINSLKQIAKALEIPLYFFFQDDAHSEEMVVRNGSRKTIGLPGQSDVTYELLTPDVRGSIEFCLMTVHAGSNSGDLPQSHNGEEVAFVMQGPVELMLGAQETQLLHSGDSVRIPALVQHRWINRFEAPAQVIFAITPPSF